MKKYRVNVNGTVYEVEIEEMNGQAAAPAASAPAPAAPASAPAASAAAETIAAPMPGTVLQVKVAAGEQVKKGQVLMILEAMKMENEIMCPRDGRVVSIPVSQGASVDTGMSLITIE